MFESQALKQLTSLSSTSSDPVCYKLQLRMKQIQKILLIRGKIPLLASNNDLVLVSRLLSTKLQLECISRHLKGLRELWEGNADAERDPAVGELCQILKQL